MAFTRNFDLWWCFRVGSNCPKSMNIWALSPRKICSCWHLSVIMVLLQRDGRHGWGTLESCKAASTVYTTFNVSSARWAQCWRLAFHVTYMLWHENTCTNIKREKQKCNICYNLEKIERYITKNHLSIIRYLDNNRYKIIKTRKFDNTNKICW